MHCVVKTQKKFKVILFLCFFLKSTEIWRETENIVHFLAFSLPTKGAEEQIVTAIAISSGHCVTDVVSLWGRFWLPYSSKMCHLFQRDHSVLKWWWWFVSVAILLPFTQIPWISACVPLCELTVGHPCSRNGPGCSIPVGKHPSCFSGSGAAKPSWPWQSRGTGVAGMDRWPCPGSQVHGTGCSD